MERCENCGNAYARTFTVSILGKTYHFDCFECAINKLAPECKTCGTKIIGHGMEDGMDYFCCAGCARMNGVTTLKDHAERPVVDI